MPHIHQINISNGGVPKLAVLSGHAVRIGVDGVQGDRQNDTRHHGGPDRAVCLFSLEVIEQLRAEGHPIAPGTTGENLTISGLDWPSIQPGTRLLIGVADHADRVELEIVSYTRPCSAIRDSFANLHHNRIYQNEHPGQSRVYACVRREGSVRVGDPVSVL